MSKVCEVCNKGPATGHNVSHSVRRTKRRFMPNLTTKKIFDPKTGETTKVKICMKCLKTSSKA
ncbi:50S ribosomal protein L28 [Candidatus Peregrinibacteria bacterium]|nr:50S ribosomal protein L28 [Candidatus Peregrinibacteria bacterium]